MSMTHLFITASGTEIGKTYVTAALTYAWRKRHRPVMAIKPVVSGLSDGLEASDTAQIAQALGRPLSSAVVDAISPWRFLAALAPSAAAALEGKSIRYDQVIQSCRQAMADFPTLFIEGAGGAYSPLTDDKLNADLISDLGIPCVVITGSYLGAQSHAIATIKALQQQDIHIKAFIVSQSEKCVGLDSTKEVIEEFTGESGYTLSRTKGKYTWKDRTDLDGLIRALV